MKIKNNEIINNNESKKSKNFMLPVIINNNSPKVKSTSLSTVKNTSLSTVKNTNNVEYSLIKHGGKDILVVTDYKFLQIMHTYARNTYFILIIFSMLIGLLMFLLVTTISFNIQIYVTNDNVDIGSGGTGYLGVTVLGSNLWTIVSSLVPVVLYLSVPIAIGIAIAKSNASPLYKCILILTSVIVITIFLKYM